jgi:hypothetical protein
MLQPIAAINSCLICVSRVATLIEQVKVRAMMVPNRISDALSIGFNIRLEFAGLRIGKLIGA